MICLSELTCAVYVDGELSPEETRDAERHLAECARCRALVAALRGENRVLGEALEEMAGLAPSRAPGARLEPIPDSPAVVASRRWAWPWSLLVMAAVVVSGLAAIAALTRWRDLTAEPSGDWIGLAVDAGLFVLLNAAVLELTLAAVAVVTMVGLALAGGLYLARTPARAILVLALAAGVTATLAAPRAEALEARRGRDVVVAAGETLDGTLVAAGKSVRVDGTIQGDLIVAAAHVDVRGTVRGDLVVAARAVEVAGTVQGSVYAAAGSLTVRGRVGRGLYAANRSTALEAGSGVGGDVALVGRSASLDGPVEGGASILAHDAEVSGRIGRDVRFRGDRLAVRAPARVKGTIHADVRRASAVTVDDAASVTGPVLTRVVSRAAGWYGEPRVWFWAVTRFFGAVLLGWIGLIVTPTLIVASADGVRSWQRSLGWGLLTLVGGPVAMLLLAVTLVGIPLALILLGFYLFGLYAAKVVVGLALGRALLRPRGTPRRDALWALVIGLALITLAASVPWLGGPVRLVVTCLGAGALVWRLAQMAGVVRSFIA
jgi:cytoskeletal protein CcmA (bactofilin family)